MLSRRWAVLNALTEQEGDSSRQLVLHGGTVLTMDEQLGEIDADVLIVGTRVEAVGPALNEAVRPDAVVVDVSRCIVIPGLVDSHIHAWEGALRGLGPEASFSEYLAITHHGLAPLMTPEDIAAGQRVTAAQALHGGVTTIVDNSHNSRTPEHSDAAIEALVDAGIRAVHAVGSPVTGGDGGHLPADLFRLRAQYGSRDHRMLSIRIFDMVPTVASWRFAADHGFEVVAEMGFWVDELDALLDSGLAGPSHTYNHCSRLSAGQWRAIADCGAAVNMVPRSDAQFGLGGFVPILNANRLGIQEGISCDNEVSYGYDMFAEMRTLITVQRGLCASASDSADLPPLYGPREALRAATIGGSVNAGLADTIGSITPGKEADLVVLDLDHIPTRPSGPALGTVVNFASAVNVDAVLVGGRVRKWAGQLVGCDYSSIAATAEMSRDRLLAKFGADSDDLRLGRGIAARRAAEEPRRQA